MEGGVEERDKGRGDRGGSREGRGGEGGMLPHHLCQQTSILVQ